MEERAIPWLHDLYMKGKARRIFCWLQKFALLDALTDPKLREATFQQKGIRGHFRDTKICTCQMVTGGILGRPKLNFSLLARFYFSDTLKTFLRQKRECVKEDASDFSEQGWRTRERTHSSLSALR